MNLTQENLPPSSISVFLTGFVAEQVQNENNLFKFIKLAVTEFVGGVNTGKKFLIKCRYLKSDERINKKIMKTRKNSSVLITGELICIESEFQVEIQDMNFLSTSVSNIESATTSTNVSSLYSWSATNQNTGRISAQAVALLNERADVNKNLTESLTDTQSLSSNDEDLTTASPNNQISNINEDDASNNLNNNKNNKRGRKRARK